MELTNLKSQVQLNFADGSTSFVDAKVAKWINELQKEQSLSDINLPFFWNLSKSLNNYSEIFKEFFTFLIENHKLSSSQLYQDLFVLFNFEKKLNGRFLEFGASDGILRSNTFLLEKKFGWNGVLAEPSPQWQTKLKINRPNCKVINKCIYSESGKELDFFVSEHGELSTIEKFKNSDIASMPGNSTARNHNGYNTKVSSISLNDVFVKYFDSEQIDYMSVDTEGSELEILTNFDFKNFSPKIVTVEHNFTDQQQKLDELFMMNGYLRFFKDYTQFDAWYVLQT